MYLHYYTPNRLHTFLFKIMDNNELIHFRFGHMKRHDETTLKHNVAAIEGVMLQLANQ